MEHEITFIKWSLLQCINKLSITLNPSLGRSEKQHNISCKNKQQPEVS